MCVFIVFLRLFCSSLRCLPSECKNVLDPASPALGVLYPSTPNCSTPICCNPKRCGSRCCRPSSVLHQPQMNWTAFSTSNRWWSSNSVPGSLGILVERFHFASATGSPRHCQRLVHRHWKIGVFSSRRKIALHCQRLVHRHWKLGGKEGAASLRCSQSLHCQRLVHTHAQVRLAKQQARPPHYSPKLQAYLLHHAASTGNQDAAR
jgi:hypothetical protein